MSFDTTKTISPALNPGDQLGYYDVQSPLAQGGLSLVWKGYDRLLDRHVAIKQVAGAEEIDEEVRQRFNQEADLQKQVSASHKNIVEVIDLIDDPRGLFIVMEYVDGSSLDHALAQLDGPMDPKQALGIIQQIALGLSAIHEAGVLHRDLKPSNILLPREGGVKICDFGLATLQAEQESLTIGTARYMAPELFTSTEADARADLYSLGMIAYEMLAGRPAFEETFKTVMRDQRNQALRWMKWHTNPRLSAPALSKLNEDVPSELSEMVERLMAKDPGQRIASTQQLLEVIRRTFSGRAKPQQSAAPSEPVETAPVTSSEATAPLPRRSKLPIILGAILLGQAVILGGLWYYFYEYKPAAEQQQVRQAALDEFEQAQQLYRQERAYSQAGRIFSQLAKQWRDDPQLGPPAMARAFICQARIIMQQSEQATKDSEFARSEKLYTQAMDALRQARNAVDNPGLHEHIDELRSEVEFRKAFANEAATIVELTKEGNYSAARNRIRIFRETKLVDTEEQILNQLGAKIEDQATQAEIDRILADAKDLEEQDRLAEALSAVRAGQEDHSSRRLDEYEAELSEQIRYSDLIERARSAEDRSDFAAALSLYRQVDDIKPSNKLKDKMTELRRRRAYQEGRDAEMASDFDTAEAKYKQALPLPEAKQALERLGQAVTRQSLVQAAESAMASNKYSEAVELYEQAQDIQTTPEIERKLNRAKVRMNANRAREALNANDLSAARNYIDQALAIDPTDPEVNRAAEDLRIYKEYREFREAGDQARRASDFGSAIEAYRKARETLKGTGIDMSEINKRLEDTEYDSWIAKAKVAIEARDWKQARAHLKAAENVRRQTTDLIQRLRREIEANAPDDA